MTTYLISREIHSVERYQIEAETPEAALTAVITGTAPPIEEEAVSFGLPNIVEHASGRDVTPEIGLGELDEDDLRLATDEELAAARELFETDSLQIDDGALVSKSDSGLWVQGWVLLDDLAPELREAARPRRGLH